MNVEHESVSDVKDIDYESNIDDLLIDLVEQNPLLYNTSDPDYKCIAKRLVYWKRIAAKLGIPAKTCQIKWKNIRYNYFKARKDNLDLNQAFRHKRYTRRLEFLDSIPLIPKKPKVKKLKIDFVDATRAQSPKLNELNFQDYYKMNVEKTIEDPSFEHSYYSSNKIEEDEIIAPNQIETREMEAGEVENSTHSNRSVHNQIQNSLSSIEMYCLSLAEPLGYMEITERERVKFEIARIFKDARYIK